MSQTSGLANVLIDLIWSSDVEAPVEAQVSDSLPPSELLVMRSNILSTKPPSIRIPSRIA